MKRLFISISMLVGVGILFFALRPAPNVAEFAKCLTEKGAVFLTAYYCEPCQRQKAMFGSSVQYLNVRECADTQSWDQGCNARLPNSGIPQWWFADGSAVAGIQSFDALATKTGCRAPKHTARN